MAVSFFKMSALRIDLARNLEAGFDNYQEVIAGGYADFAAPLLEDGETAPDVSFQVELMKRAVAGNRRRLETFDGGVVEQIHEDDKVRDELGRRHTAVAGKMRRMRDICRGMHGPESLRRVGLDKEPEKGSMNLYQQGLAIKTSLERVGSPPSGGTDLSLEPVLEIKTGEGVDPPSVQLAAQLEPELSELGELIASRHQENRRSADVRSRRRRVLREFDRDVRAIVRTAQGMFRLAGRDDLAARFRPILRRVLRRLRKVRAEEAAAQAAEAAAGKAAAEKAGEKASGEPAETAKSSEQTA